MEIEASRLAVNSNPTISKVRFGPDPEDECLIVDDIYVDPLYIRDLALQLDYRSRRGYFPGYDARISLFQEDLAALFREHIDPAVVLAGSDMTFSMMHFEELDETRRFQPVPHVDTVQKHPDGPDGVQLAAVLYLNLPHQCRGGTGIYRHRETGMVSRGADMCRGLAEYMLRHDLRSVDDAYTRILDRSRIPRGDAESIQFISDSNDEWELATLLEMRFNRMVVYDSLFFHSAYVEPEWFGSTKDARRITQTIFLSLPVEIVTPV